jgi:hypothetical protein
MQKCIAPRTQTAGAVLGARTRNTAHAAAKESLAAVFPVYAP